MKNRKVIAMLSMLMMGISFQAQAQRNIRQEEANKKLVLNFYQKLFGDKDLSAIDKYIAEDYIQHNPTVGDGREALKNAAKGWFVGAKKELVDIPHSAGEGDLVFLHIRRHLSEGKDRAIVDIFRVKNNKIVEHWDVIQDTPDNAVNDHPMF